MSNTWVARSPVVNLYAEPSGTTEVTSQILYGAPVDLLEHAGPWARVRMADGYEGYALQASLCQWALLPGSHTARVMQLSANVYRRPDVKSQAPLLNLPWESTLELTSLEGSGEGNRWLPVRLLDGTGAFVQRGDIAFNPAPCSLDEMLTLAHRFLGITYTWGGTSTRGYDCSGFVQMLFRQAGIHIPRDAQAQSRWAGFAPVERAALRAADVLFFGDTPDEITHVGLCLDADRFIHDTTDTQPCVQISRVDEEPWTQRLCAQRRLREDGAA